MATAPSFAPSARLPLVHGSLLFSLLGMAGVFAFFLLYGSTGPLLGEASNLTLVAMALAGVSLVLTVVAVGLLRPRLPPRPASQTLQAYWEAPEQVRAALMLWVVIEQGGVVGLVGWLLTGSAAPAVAGLVAITAMVLHSPGYLAGR